MKSRTSDLFLRVVVRRVVSGPAPFGWEVSNGDTIVPLHVSLSRFGTMEAGLSCGTSQTGRSDAPDTVDAVALIGHGGMPFSTGFIIKVIADNCIE